MGTCSGTYPSDIEMRMTRVGHLNGSVGVTGAFLQYHTLETSIVVLIDNSQSSYDWQWIDVPYIELVQP